MWMAWYPDMADAERVAYSLPQTIHSWVVDGNVAEATKAFALGQATQNETAFQAYAARISLQRREQRQLEGLIGQLFDTLDAADYFHPPDRTPATKNTIRTILTKAGWSNREVQAMRGIVRALSEPRRR